VKVCLSLAKELPQTRGHNAGRPLNPSSSPACSGQPAPPNSRQGLRLDRFYIIMHRIQNMGRGWRRFWAGNSKRATLLNPLPAVRGANFGSGTFAFGDGLLGADSVSNVKGPKIGAPAWRCRPGGGKKAEKAARSDFSTSAASRRPLTSAESSSD
jgi:hypothetical protein